jgi:hypothetical protein
MIEQIHIPFAPELAGSIDISNQIAESGIGSWLEKHWKALVALIGFILFMIWINGGFDKKPVSKEEPKPRPITPSSPQPTRFPHLQTPRT